LKTNTLFDGALSLTAKDIYSDIRQDRNSSFAVYRNTDSIIKTVISRSHLTTFYASYFSLTQNSSMRIEGVILYFAMEFFLVIKDYYEVTRLALRA